MFGFIKNLGKNNNNFYLELKEGNDSKPTVAKQPQAKSESSNGAKPSEATAAPQPAVPATANIPKKETAAKAARIAQENEATAAKPPVAKEAKAPTEVNFATKYLLTASTSERRRPGANMNPFLEMARDVKVPINKK
jgi:hypothetical protein